jgi:hypothetical protein
VGDSSPHVQTKLDDDLLNRFSFNRTTRGKSVTSGTASDAESKSPITDNHDDSQSRCAVAAFVADEVVTGSVAEQARAPGGSGG